MLHLGIRHRDNVFSGDCGQVQRVEQLHGFDYKRGTESDEAVKSL